MSKEMKLTHGQVAIVDDSFPDKTIAMKDIKWNAVKSKSGGWHATATLVMHRLVIDAEKGIIVDHRDRDGLHNEASNLRPTTVAGNAANRATPKSSKYIGVTRIQNKSSVRYRSYITLKGKYQCIGHYEDEDTAARMRDELAYEAFGWKAELNFPDDFDMTEPKDPS